MLTWLRIRWQADNVLTAAIRPVNLLRAQQPELFPALWQTPYCCTLSYFWTAVIAEGICKGAADDEKFRALREAFERMVKASGGTSYEAMKRVLPDGHPARRRALTDLKRVVSLYHGRIDDRQMIYPEYRHAVEEDGRRVPKGGRQRSRHGSAHEMLLVHYLAGNVIGGEQAVIGMATGWKAGGDADAR